jgi:hypothetical protein
MLKYFRFTNFQCTKSDQKSISIDIHYNNMEQLCLCHVKRRIFEKVMYEVDNSVILQ